MYDRAGVEEIWDQIWSRHTIVLNVWVWSRHQPKLIPGPVAGILVRLVTAGPGISQRAAAARTQTVWRWLVVTSNKPQASSVKLDKKGL